MLPPRATLKQFVSSSSNLAIPCNNETVSLLCVERLSKTGLKLFCNSSFESLCCVITCANPVLATATTSFALQVNA